MSMLRKKFIVLFILLFICIAATGCSGKKQEDESNKTLTTESVENSTPEDSESVESSPTEIEDSNEIPNEDVEFED